MKIANAAHCDCEDMGDSSLRNRFRNRYRRPRGSSARSSDHDEADRNCVLAGWDDLV